jgi:anti-sigma B factor antagonist
VADYVAQPAESAVSAYRDGCEVGLTRSHGLVVLSVHGAVDMASAPTLSEAICDALGQLPVGIIVDLTNVDFLACIAMSVLIAAQRAADATFVRFGVVANGVATSRPIRLLGLDVTMTLYPTLDEALRDFPTRTCAGRPHRRPHHGR